MLWNAIMKVTLLKNAYGFLEESLSKAIKAESDATHWKYAAFNLVQTIELSLKEKLRREHPILIFRNIDSPKSTVDLHTALKRLHTICKINFSNSDINAINKASDLRNQIVHYEYCLNEKKIKLIFAKLIGFLSHFHAVHLELMLAEVIDPDLWQEALSILSFAEELYKRAQKMFKDKQIDQNDLLICPSCQYDTFVINDNGYTCYICGHYSNAYECKDCNEILFEMDQHELLIEGDEIGTFCTDCYEKRISNDDRHYHEMMSHFWGK